MLSFARFLRSVIKSALWLVRSGKRVRKPLRFRRRDAAFSSSDLKTRDDRIFRQILSFGKCCKTSQNDAYMHRNWAVSPQLSVKKSGRISGRNGNCWRQHGTPFRRAVFRLRRASKAGLSRPRFPTVPALFFWLKAGYNECVTPTRIRSHDDRAVPMRSVQLARRLRHYPSALQS
jgi:hypothetical protein